MSRQANEPRGDLADRALPYLAASAGAMAAVWAAVLLFFGTVGVLDGLAGRPGVLGGVLVMLFNVTLVTLPTIYVLGTLVIFGIEAALGSMPGWKATSVRPWAYAGAGLIGGLFGGAAAGAGPLAVIGFLGVGVVAGLAAALALLRARYGDPKGARRFTILVPLAGIVAVVVLPIVIGVLGDPG